MSPSFGTGAWLSSHRPLKVRKRRLLLLGCIAAGLIQKPVISLAWDMRMFEQCISKIHKFKGTCHLIGCTAVLLRQVFAAEAQQVVLQHARALAVAGKSWSAVSLRSLLRRLRKLHVRDASKRRGRMSQFTGPLWVERVLESRANLLQFQKAGACLWQVFDTSAIAEDLPTVDALCVELKARSRLPLVGKYSVPHLVRACPKPCRCCFHVANGCAHGPVVLHFTNSDTVRPSKPN